MCRITSRSLFVVEPQRNIARYRRRSREFSKKRFTAAVSLQVALTGA
jgi:hypothetical protein